MATTTLLLKYRPIKIGFLVREGSVEDLVKASEINTLLWGGVYNPIIPISETNDCLPKQLINLFSVDILFAVSHTKEIDDFINDNSFLKSPNYKDDIFYETGEMKTNELCYLDSMNIVSWYWEKEIKYKPTRYKSNCTLISWDRNDKCKDLFSIMFGYFSKSYNLKDDFENAFLTGLKSKEVEIKNDSIIDNKLAKAISPIEFTSLKIKKYNNTWLNDGIYIGSENNFTDLLYFWNLRASGLMIEFLPINHIERFHGFIKDFIKQLNEMPTKNPDIKESIAVYSFCEYEEIKKIINNITGDIKLPFYKCDKSMWNGSNIITSINTFCDDKVLASIDKEYDKYNITFALPDKKFINLNGNRNIDFQKLVVSIETFNEFGYQGYTLKPPFIKELNKYYGREICFEPWNVRSEKEGIGLIIDSFKNSLSLYPISHQKLIERIFELVGYKANISQAGLLAKQIIQGMKEPIPLEACRVFKITGVRKLIASLSASKTIKWDDAIKIIGKNNFNKFKDLHIESSKVPNLTPQNVFNFMLKKKIFIPVNLADDECIFACKNCGLKERIRVKDFENYWECPNCEYKHYMPPYIMEYFLKNKDIYWAFKRGWLFAKNNNQEGSIPVVISLLTFKRIFDKIIYCTSLHLEKEKKCEIDLCVLQYDRGQKIQIGVGECKSTFDKINQKDIDNLKVIQDEMSKINIDCFMIFAKTVEKYDDDEIKLFKLLRDQNIKFIILSNKELEPYHPYWDIDVKGKLPELYVSDMEDMYKNSLHIYLTDAD